MQLWELVVTLVGAGILGVCGAASWFFARKAKESKAWAVWNEAWVVVSAVVAHVEGKLRPQVQLALVDGKMDATERSRLQAEALRLAKEALGERLGTIIRTFKLGTSGTAVDTFVSGLVERAHVALRGEKAMATLGAHLPAAPPAPIPFPVPPQR
jgi:hypothetical protein